jgi:CRP-like cAMP-binding protein
MTFGFSAADSNPIIRKLETVFSLSEEEREAILALPVQEKQIGARQDIVREGDRPTRSFAILDGVACAFKITGEAKRQIIAFHVVGDLPDLQSLHLEKLDISVSTISPCKVAFIQHDALRELCDRHPRLGSAMWRETLVYSSIFREWVANIGQREAYNRAGHLLCEFVVRLRAMGLASDYSCEMPMTQEDLADSMGISIVHVNRVLQELRKRNLIQLGQGNLTVLDWPQLKETGDFDPGYLHLGRAEKAAA